LALNPGTRLGSYIIEAPLGAGGMGEVYRARDAKLQRAVAIKVLPEILAVDPERRERFEREAQLLAAFNHPHIAQIYGTVDTHNGTGAIVMELVDGATLSDRIAQGPIPIDETLAIASQIVDAMDAAHSRGIVHRDLKPANIKLTSDGSVKVLDFGLAKTVAPDTGGPVTANAMNSPTFTSPGTAIGLILGTAAYMAPEQARGKSVDKRTDIWAFGCIVFEMLAGKRLFDGADVSDILAAVLRAEIDWTKLPANMSPSLRRLLTRCLERDPNKRLRDIGDARFELEAALQQPLDHAARPTRSRSRIVATSLILVALTVIATGAGVWRLKPDRAVPLRKYDVLSDVRLEPVETPTMSLSPDGSHITYVTAGHLWVRDLDQIKPRDLGPAESAYATAWSPDSASIAYASDDGVIRRVPVGGGTPITVCSIPDSKRVIGLRWSGDDLILAVWRSSLYRVDARGGSPKQWAPIDPKTEIDFHALTVLPDGRAIFATHRGNDHYTLESWDGKTRTELLPTELIRETTYSAGHLLFLRDKPNAGLWAIRVGTGPLNPATAFLVEPIAQWVSASDDGTVLITAASGEPPVELALFDRAGKATKSIGSPARFIAEPTFSPDGKRVLLVRGSGRESVEVWLHDIATARPTRLTFKEQGDGAPAWFPSGDRILYTDHYSTVNGARVVSLAADGSDQARPLVAAMGADISSDGKHLLYLLDEKGTGRLRYADVMPDGSIGPARTIFKGTEPNIHDAVLSSDGQLLAYVEVTANGQELFVTRFPSGEGRWQPLTGIREQIPHVRRELRWARDAHELLFPLTTARPGRVRMTSVGISNRGTVKVGDPIALFETDLEAVNLGFDISADGKSIVMARAVSDESNSPRRRFILVQRWLDEFEKH
jgi:eukaryotic-like serine/threonine-protein kinase